MAKKNNIVLTDDQAFYKMHTSLVRIAGEIGHGTMSFTGSVTVHEGRVKQIELSVPRDNLKFRDTPGT